MKFVETLNGTYVNADCISHIGHELEERTFTYYSYIYLQDGTALDFIEVPDCFVDHAGKEHPFDCDHLITLHRNALETIIDYRGTVVDLDFLVTDSWEKFVKEFEIALMKFEENHE